jgi:hypothetical protein
MPISVLSQSTIAKILGVSSYTFEPSIGRNSIGVVDFYIGCLNIKPIKIETIYGNESNGDYYYLRKFVKNKD